MRDPFFYRGLRRWKVLLNEAGVGFRGWSFYELIIFMIQASWIIFILKKKLLLSGEDWMHTLMHQNVKVSPNNINFLCN